MCSVTRLGELDYCTFYFQTSTERSTTDLPWGKGGRCLGLTTLPLSCADFLKSLRVSTTFSPRDVSGPVQRYFISITPKNVPYSISVGVKEMKFHKTHGVNQFKNCTFFLNWGRQRKNKPVLSAAVPAGNFISTALCIPQICFEYL